MGKGATAEGRRPLPVQGCRSPQGGTSRRFLGIGGQSLDWEEEEI